MRLFADLVVLPFRHGPFWNFSYLIGCAETGEAVAIDPAWNVEAILSAAAGRDLRISTAILTHGHDDHAHGTGALVDRTGARVFVHSAELTEVRRVYQGPLVEVSGRTELAVGRLAIHLLPTPGHTPGSLSVLVGDQLFSGDTLHVGAVGRPGADSGAARALWESVQALLDVLPESTVIRPGHDSGPEPSSTIGTERARVPALRARSFADFVQSIEHAHGRTVSLDGTDG